MRPRRIVSVTLLTVLIAIVVGSPPVTYAATETVVVQWNAAALEAGRRSTIGPPAIARALAIVHTCIYDAWAAYDPIAAGVHYQVKHASPATEEQKARAVSYAAYRALMNLFPGQRPLFDDLMAELGYIPGDLSDPDSARGADAAQGGLDFRQADGANQSGQYADYTGYAPANTPSELLDPNRWQPLLLPSGTAQSLLVPQWGLVVPFALVSADQFRAAPPPLYPHGLYRKQALDILHVSAQLSDQQKVIASYWADGPRTETPPGHWCLFAQFVSQRDAHSLEQDVKLFFALANGLLDASIAVWDAKRHYDYVRPVTAIRFLSAGRLIRAWGGPYQGTQLIPGDQWRSYISTPPFAEFVSGHSTFSAASAEILKSFTGSDEFGAQVTIPSGSSPIEPGLVPRHDVTLSWRTFSDAADEAGLSRRFGGIHFEAGDLEGRALGRQIGALVWQKARAYFDGVPVP
jgi:VCPO second helical-bundle domain/Domain of unknown function (DUF6851)